MRQKRAKALRRWARSMATGYPKVAYENHQCRNGSIQRRLDRSEKLALKMCKQALGRVPIANL